jgi:hypothetical protein
MSPAPENARRPKAPPEQPASDLERRYAAIGIAAVAAAARYVDKPEQRTEREAASAHDRYEDAA